MKFRQTPPAEYIRSILDYNPDTGIFVWKYRNEMPAIWNGKWTGEKAGLKKDRIVQIRINGIRYCAHRLAWVYVHGDPLDNGICVDHKNCDQLDNRIENLRLATHGENNSNSRLRKKKKSGLPKGVRIAVGSDGTIKYIAQISINRKMKYLGTFQTGVAAHQAYMCAAVAAKGEFARAA